MRKMWGYLIFGALVLSAPLSFGQEMTARDIVKNSEDLMRGNSQSGLYSMTVVTPQWERRLKIAVLTKGRDKNFLRILSPAKEKGITTLRVKNEMWNYLPAVERTIKIPPSMMLEPWMGSDFANDDLVKESSIVEDYDHKIIGSRIINGSRRVRVELIPKPNAGVVWSRRVMVIDTTTFIPFREEFYGKNNKLIKTLTYTNIKKVSDRSIPTRWEMVSEIKKGRRTIIEVEPDLVYNGPVSDSEFSLQSLKNQ